MSDIYVPIDVSEVKDVIPPGEDIIYSTLCNVRESHGSGGPGTYTKKWTSHVLMTQKGFAYNIPRKRKTAELIYVGWADGLLSFRNLLLDGIKQFRLLRNSQYESKDRFKERSKKLALKFLPIIIERMREEIEACKQGYETKYNLRYYEKRIRKSEKWLLKAERKFGYL